MKISVSNDMSAIGIKQVMFGSCPQHHPAPVILAEKQETRQEASSNGITMLWKAATMTMANPW